ncbi:MAG: hypothetical protein AAGE84_11015 [Cyanobacteria bacterium P01_G01_bin.39]
MSSFKIDNILVSILSASTGLFLVANRPLLAQQVAIIPDRYVPGNSAALREMQNVSTQASDLWESNSHKLKKQPESVDSLLVEKLAQGEVKLARTCGEQNRLCVGGAGSLVDLKTFCENYPYNSRCSEVAPADKSDSGDHSTGSAPTTDKLQSSNSQQKSGWAIVPEASTLGLGGQVVRKITPNFNARVGVNGFGLGIDIEETDVDYEGDLSLFNVSTIIDVHPFKKSGFRVSGGLIFGDNSFDGSADISDEVAAEIEGESFSLEELNIDQLATVDADIDLNNSVAPYLGIGGGNAVGEGKGLGFWWNLGVVLGGSPDVEITSNIADEVPDAVREEAEAAADRVLEDEEEELEDELDFINIYPVVSLGFSYQF